jgi:hypothetical protein
VKWILGLLNPVGAFIKACMAIYDIVMFFIHHGEEIAVLINAILDNLAAIVAGNISAAADKVEGVMAKAIPLVIGFLASLLGVGGIGEKVKSVINAVQKPINKAVDWVLKTVVKPVARLAARAVGWVKGKAKSASAWLKKKAQAGIGKVKDKLKSTFGKRDRRTPAERRASLESAMRDAQTKLESPDTSVHEMKQRLPVLRAQHKVKELKLVIDKESEAKETVHLVGANSPRVSGPSVTKRIYVAQAEGEEASTSPETVTAIGNQTNKEPWSEREIQKLVNGARRLQGRSMQELEKIPPEQIETKTVACAGAVTTKSGWGNIQDLEQAGPVSQAEQEQRDIAIRQHVATEALLFEQGKKLERQGQLPSMLTPKGQAVPSNLGPAPTVEDMDVAFAEWNEGTAGTAKPKTSPAKTSEFQYPVKPAAGEEYRARRGGAQDWGIPGKYSLSHAEKQAYALTSMPTVGVSRGMCEDCQAFFLQSAKDTQKVLVVADPEMARVFLPNGTMARR